MKKEILISMMMLAAATACTNRPVQSGSYNLMLKTLLSHSVDEISVDSLQKVRDEVVLLDTRSAEEFEVSHIRNALFVGFKEFDSTAVENVPKDQKVVVYCSVGYRSEKIAEKLKDMGYSDVSNLYGGIFEWINQGNEVVNQSGPTQSIHAYSRTWGWWLNEGEKVYSAGEN